LVDRCEELIERLSGSLHPNHYLILRLKSQLISQYGNVPGFLYGNLPEELLRRKIDLCQEYIQVPAM
jgi:hypothetical protein